MRALQLTTGGVEVSLMTGTGIGPTDDDATHGGEVGGSPAPWPLTLLDVPAIRASGVGPVPFRQFVLKVQSRCNLACTYCYIYQGPDQSWRERPPAVPRRTVRRFAARIAEHVYAHHLDTVRVEMHGGEPLLRGPGPLLEAAQLIREALPSWCVAQITVQTNGTLLTERGLDRLASEGIRIGLSLDGGTARLNRHRIDHAGRASWPAAMRAARLLAAHPQTYAGILATIDVDGDPKDVYDSLLSLAPPTFDLLLPHATWSDPPPAGPGRHGAWLAQLFDLWWDARQAGPPIRLFFEIIGGLLGRPSTTEALGLSPMAAAVVDTDGSIEQVDALRWAYDGAAATGLDVFRHSFDAALDHPGVVARQLGLEGLAPECQDCPLVRVCGGGNYVHRYRRDRGFLNPSVYCQDLDLLIRHVAERLEESFARSTAWVDQRSEQCC
jgi:uncharacterized protein